MSQFNLDDPINPATKSGTALASDLSSWRDALHSCHSGTSRPSYAEAGTIWINTAGTPWVVYMYDGNNDITIGTVNATTDKFIPGASASSVFNDIKQAASTTVSGVVELATAAETEGHTDNTRVVTPFSMANIAPRAWICFSGTGGVATVNAEVGVSSLVRDAVGVYTINFDNVLSDTNFVVFINDVYNTPDGAKDLWYDAKTTSSVTVHFSFKTNNQSGSETVYDPADASVVIFGK